MTNRVLVFEEGLLQTKASATGPRMELRVHSHRILIQRRGRGWQ